MTVFAAIGLALVIIAGAYLIYAAIGLSIFLLGFTGTLKSGDGLYAAVVLVIGAALITVAIYYSPFHVRVSF